MNSLKGFVLLACLAAPLQLVATASSWAETTAATGADAAKTGTSAKADEDKDGSKMSETDRRAKAAECSKQADAKKLHGEARKKFRSACKRGK